MIYVELKLLPERRIYDMDVDENSCVKDVLEELHYYLGIESESSELISVRKQTILSRNRTLYQQGVRGGDTLVILQNIITKMI